MTDDASKQVFFFQARGRPNKTSILAGSMWEAVNNCFLFCFVFSSVFVCDNLEQDIF